MLLAAEALRDVPSTPATVDTPLGPRGRPRRSGDVVVVPVLRAGLGMLDAVLELLPSARVGHIGLQRDEATAIASRYYSKLPPNLTDSFVLMIDPMLATGGSAVAAIDLLQDAGPATIRMMCIVAGAGRRGAGRAASSRTSHIYTPVIESTSTRRSTSCPASAISAIACTGPSDALGSLQLRMLN